MLRKSKLGTKNVHMLNSLWRAVGLIRSGFVQLKGTSEILQGHYKQILRFL